MVKLWCFHLKKAIMAIKNYILLLRSKKTGLKKQVTEQVCIVSSYFQKKIVTHTHTAYIPKKA